jgi:DNA helicase II / ATP-dependent DNA helicase PcrA
MSLEFNEQQKKAVEHNSGPLLIIAGAGTGKTAVVTGRILYLLRKKLAKPSEILALTFMEKAANEMIERVDLEMPLGYEEVSISTFHSFCDRVLRQEGFFLGMDPNYKLMTEAESYAFFKRNIFKFPLETLRPLNAPAKFIREILNFYSRLQDEDVDFEEFAKYVKGKKGVLEKEEYVELKELADTYKVWTELKEKEARMSFGDLIANTLKLFREKPHILKKYRERFKYVLVDEYQDTNYSQNILVNVLMLGKDFEKASAQERKKANITVVGDDDQAIYKFRGAAISNILQFKEVYPSLKRIVLTQNYRSNQEILDCAYGLIKNNNPYRLEETEGIEKRLFATKEPVKNAVNLVFSSDSNQEADSIAKEILNLVGKEKSDVQKYDSKGQASLLSSSKGDYKFSDIAILIRANSHADDIVTVLRYYGIPYKFSGKKTLYTRPEVKFLISFLKVVCDYKDDLSMFNLLQMDLWNLKTSDFMEVFGSARREKTSSFKFLDSVLKGRRENFAKKSFSQEGLQSFKLLMDILKKSFDKVKEGRATSQILYDFLTESGYLKSLEREDTAENNFKLQNLSKFFELVKQFEQENKDTNIFEYLDYLEYSVDIGETPSIDDDVFAEYDAVNIYTVHGAKGLEFPVVFMSSLVKGRFPSRNMSDTLPVPDELVKEKLPDENDESTNIQEERRLFYVGATRAKDKLFLSAAQYYGESRSRKSKPSVFLNELLSRDVEEELESVEREEFSFAKNICSTGDDIDPASLPKDFGKRISYSEINDYEACPKKYRYKYVLKIPVPLTHNATFGSVIHITLKDFYRLVKSANEGFEGFFEKPTLDDLYRLYEKNWRSEGYESKKHEQKKKKKGYEMLEKFFNEIHTGKEQILDLERRFKFKVEDIVVSGAVDRIDRLGDDVVELIDYKTGKARDQKEVDSDIQLVIYGIFAKESMQMEKVKASLMFLNEGIKMETEVDEKKMDEVREKIVEIAGSIAKCEFKAKPDYFGCRFCDYKSVCEDVFS